MSNELTPAPSHAPKRRRAPEREVLRHYFAHFHVGCERHDK
jgi:hypothetical protein